MSRNWSWQEGWAVNFILEYGWGILAGIIAVAVLWYFGFFNPHSYSDKDNCLKQFAENYCNSINLNFSGTISTDLANNKIFYCSDILYRDYRKDGTNESIQNHKQTFYFLPEEIKNCTITK
jgi:hypothetical protein